MRAFASWWERTPTWTRAAAARGAGLLAVGGLGLAVLPFLWGVFGPATEFWG